jgi:tRNA pseudouridine38-40 synthase
MRAAASALRGQHDFSAFRAADCPARTTVREVRRFEIDVERLGVLDAERVRLTIEATAFLKHMVRNMVGTLVEVGHGKRAAGSVPGLLARGDRTLAGPTAPPHGLYLDEVFYLPGNADPRAPEAEHD